MLVQDITKLEFASKQEAIAAAKACHADAPIPLDYSFIVRQTCPGGAWVIQLYRELGIPKPLAGGVALVTKDKVFTAFDYPQYEQVVVAPGAVPAFLTKEDAQTLLSLVKDLKVREYYKENMTAFLQAVIEYLS